MRAAALTLVRILAWAFVVIGTLFALMQVWLLGVPLLIVGGLGVFATNQTLTPTDVVNVASNGYESNQLQEHEELMNSMDENDPHSPVFLLTDEERWRNERSIDEMLGDDDSQHL